MGWSRGNVLDCVLLVTFEVEKMGGRGSAVTFVIEVSFEHNQVELCVKQSKMPGSQLLFLFFFCISLERLRVISIGFKVGVACVYSKKAWKVVLSQSVSHHHHDHHLFSPSCLHWSRRCVRICFGVFFLLIIYIRFLST